MSTTRRRPVSSPNPNLVPSSPIQSTKSQHDIMFPQPVSARNRRRRKIPYTGIIYFVLLCGSYFILRRLARSLWSSPISHIPNDIIVPSSDTESNASVGNEIEVEGHADFGDGRKRTVKKDFLIPESTGSYWVNVMLGNGGPTPDLSGGMIPAVAPPFGMTRWTSQTRQNYVSMCPYNQTDSKIHGFIGTHQPAIWMGESGPSQISAGLGTVVTDFNKRGLPFRREDEYASGNYYRNLLDAGNNGKIDAEMSATSRVGHLRFTFHPQNGARPHVIVQASRGSVITNDPTNITYPLGEITVDKDRKEVYWWNDERQDRILLSEEIPCKSFKGYFVARFSKPFDASGISHKGELRPEILKGMGEELAGFITFAENVKSVDVRVGVSFISVDQARRNLDLEIPDGQSLEETSRQTRAAWAEKLDTLKVLGASASNLTVLYTSLAHTLVYPYEISENTGATSSYYSGYLDKVITGISYSGYSIWDTFRAETAWLSFLAPERVGEMIQSMLQDYKEGGWLPMWKNLVETNIMVGTHSDVIIAQAMQAGVRDFDWDLAWEAVRKNAMTPPDRDTELIYADREQHTPQEARAGLTEYLRLGYVAADLHAEAGSRTLDYAYDDYAASLVASHVNAHTDANLLRERSNNYKKLWNAETGFMATRKENGEWAGHSALATGEWSGESAGWTEGDKWAYSFNVMHDIPGLIELVGGNSSFVDFLDRHFEGGHNLHTNEPSHHIPYLYAFAGATSKTQEKVLEIAQNNYDATATGLSGNEDCGQMSAWYLFSAMGFYPVDPASATYVIGTPFFDELSIQFPGASRPLKITALGASSGSKYIKSVTIDGQAHGSIFMDHGRIRDGAEIVFEMASTSQRWGTS